MSVMSRSILNKILYARVKQIYAKANFSTLSEVLPKKNKRGPLIISCKNKALNFYEGETYKKFDTVPLVSKGWTHTKSKNDYFTILPQTNFRNETRKKFDELPINKSIVEALNGLGVIEATEFQVRAMIALREGNHTLLAAETGCGKTIAYLLPIIQNLLETNKTEQLNSPRAIVLVPNRELAHQIADVARILCKSFDINVKSIIGGKTKREMLNPQFEDVDLLVATPGVLSKLSTVGIYRLDQVLWFVADEADTLFDDSFNERMEILINRTQGTRLVLVTATLPKKLPEFLAGYENSIEQVVSNEIHRPLLNITQTFMRINRSDKPAHLLHLTRNNKEPMIIFTSKNQTCDWLAMFLRENKIPCSNINGRMNIAIRTDQWNQFVRGETKILSATDIGSRGLNTIQVKHVLNYDFPVYTADYIHRIGRVGRFGSPKDCLVTNFVTNEDEQVKFVQKIELAIRCNEELPNVDGNITRLVRRNISKYVKENHGVLK